MLRKLGYIILFNFFYTLSAQNGQPNYNFNHISIDQRLPGANIHCIFQDEKGLIWLCVESIGLCRYDGKNYKVFSSINTDSTSLSDNFPLCIAEDKDGILWIGTTNGLNKFDRGKGVFKRYFSDDSSNCLPNNYITDLHVDGFNNIWIATEGGGLNILDLINLDFTGHLLSL